MITRLSLTRSASARFLLAIAWYVWIGASGALAELTVHEPGFEVRTFSACATRSTPPALALADAACSPGEPWGGYLYLLAHEPNPPPYQVAEGVIERLDFRGESSTFIPRLVAGPDWMAFSPAGSAFGSLLWVSPGAEPFVGPAGFDPTGTGLLGLPFDMPRWMAFDHTGRFAFDLFIHSGFGVIGGPNDSGVYRLDHPAGTPVLETVLTAQNAVPRKFGPGGAWGTDLYVKVYGSGGSPPSVQTFAPDGTLSPTVIPSSEFDWAFGPLWNGDAFARCATDTICRVKPDGSVSVFAEGASGRILSCGGFLWVLREGACSRIESLPVDATVRIAPASLNVRSGGRDFAVRAGLRSLETGEPLDSGQLAPFHLSRIRSASLGDRILPVPRAEPGCDDLTEDGLWESAEDRVAGGGGTLTLRFNVPSDGLCETRDGNRQDLIALLLEAADRDLVDICFRSESPEVAAPFEICGTVAISNPGNR